MTTPTTPQGDKPTPPIVLKNLNTPNQDYPRPRSTKQTPWRGRKIFLAMQKSAPPPTKIHDSNKILQNRKIIPFLFCNNKIKL